jgi:flagellar assembly protein FliH
MVRNVAEGSPRGGAQVQRGAAAERWALPKVEGPLAAGRSREERERAATAVLSEEQAMRGYETGIARAKAETQARLQELDARVRRMDEVLQHLSQPLKALDSDVEQQLLQLALAVGQQLARRELQIDPAQVVAIVRQCLEQLPVSAREVRVHLHPQDAACVRERLATPGEERAWSLVDDPTLARGGCVVRSEHSQIDARLQSRLATLVANALGDQRAPVRAAPDESAEGLQELPNE